MRDQEQIWREQGIDPRAADFEPLMHVLALAHAPLLIADLLSVMGRMPCAALWDEHQLRTTLATAHPLVLGDEQQGYVLAHPRLAQHFKDRLAANPPRLNEARAAFREWGSTTVERLNSGALAPEDCPQYLLEHYVAAHLDAECTAVVAGAEAGGDGPAALERYVLPLLRKGWADAWQARSSEWRGYLHDLERLGERLHAFNQGCARQQRHGELRLAEEMRCALLAATIRSKAGSLPAELIVALARAGVWSVDRATWAARQSDRAALALAELAQLARGRADLATAQALWEEALEVCAGLPQDARGTVLAPLIQRLPADSAHLPRALQIARTVADDGRRCEALTVLAEHVQGSSTGAEAVLTGILTASAAIAGEHRWRVLSAIAGRLPAQSALLGQVLEAAQSIHADGLGRAWALTAVAARLPAPQMSPLLHQALRAAVSGDGASAARDAASVLHRAMKLGCDRRVLEEALELAQQWCGGSALSAPPLEDPERWRRALQAAREAPRPACALMAMAEGLQGTQRQAVLQEAWELAKRDRGRSVNPVAVAALLDAPARAAALPEALDLLGAWGAARRGESTATARSLIAAAGRLEGQERAWVLHAALEVARAIDSAAQRAEALTQVAAHWPAPAHSPGALRLQVLREALDAAALISHAEPASDPATDPAQARVRAVRKLIVLLREDRGLLEQALQVSTLIHDGPARDTALSAISGPPAHHGLEAMTYERWHTLLAEASLSRPQLLRQAGGLARGAVQITGRAEVAGAVAGAIQEVCHWWP